MIHNLLLRNLNTPIAPTIPIASHHYLLDSNVFPMIDLTGGSNLLTNTVSVGTGPTGGSAVFLNGSQANYLRGTLTDSGAYWTDFTISFWVYRQVNISEFPEIVAIEQRSVDGTSRAFAVSLYHTLGSRIIVNWTTAPNQYFTPDVFNYSLPLEQWVKLAIRRKNVLDGWQLDLWVDGVHNQSIFAATDPVPAPSPVLTIGRLEHATYSYNLFKGGIHDLRLWNFALTDLECEAI